ncbi:hypothetical protein G3580_08085 [Nitrogeniibacter mangrovi]|uniref:Uncharacterized protein n=1 Tax=Nitrogeniibacter mangrovi TaxID=2016596 RepID=A0A6C1B1V5_9RHOO|nr:hypothetical protein [Nitrogeniibacter mangrovi]QID17606.1 hypothetical protein G3580_08085 [Nitrogeniibacter mangrovi]
MPIATFRGEKTVADIADKMYVRLTPKQRETAAAAILKANPQLADLRTVPEGAIVRVPDLPELRPKTNRSLENPDAQIADAIGDALAAADARLTTRIEQAQADLKTQTALAKDRQIKAALANAPGLQQAVDAAAKTWAADTKRLEARRSALAAMIKQASADLKGGAKGR